MMVNTDPTKIEIHFDPTEEWMEGVATHGMHSFKVPYISEIVPGLYQGGCKHGLVLPGHIEHVISLYPWEEYTVKGELNSLLAVQMFDSLSQAFDRVDVIARWVNVCREEAPTLVHCQAGLNRSGLVVARALMLGPEGYSADQAINLLREKRSPAVLCNAAFEEWLKNV